MAVMCTSVVALLVQASVWPKVGAAKDTYQQICDLHIRVGNARSWPVILLMILVRSPACRCGALEARCKRPGRWSAGRNEAEAEATGASGAPASGVDVAHECRREQARSKEQDQERPTQQPCSMLKLKVAKVRGCS